MKTIMNRMLALTLPGLLAVLIYVSGKPTLKANVFSLVGVSSVSFQLDGASLGTGIVDATDPNLYTLPWDTTTLKDGTHTVTATVTDTTGATSTTSVATFVANHGKIRIEIN